MALGAFKFAAATSGEERTVSATKIVKLMMSLALFLRVDMTHFHWNLLMSKRVRAKSNQIYFQPAWNFS